MKVKSKNLREGSIVKYRVYNKVNGSVTYWKGLLIEAQDDDGYEWQVFTPFQRHLSAIRFITIDEIDEILDGHTTNFACLLAQSITSNNLYSENKRDIKKYQRHYTGC